jgi:hypothetical protein
VEFFREYDKPGVRGLPKYGVFFVIPGEKSLFIGGKEHPRGEITPDSDYPVRAFIRGREVKPVVLGEIGKLRVLSGMALHRIRIPKKNGVRKSKKLTSLRELMRPSKVP